MFCSASCKDDVEQHSGLVTVLLELPFSVVERADLTSLQPARDAVEVESVLKWKDVNIILYLGQLIRRLTLQTPQATVHSSLVALAWLAWHSMQRSIMWLRQIAQLSTTMSRNTQKVELAIILTQNRLEIQFCWTRFFMVMSHELISPYLYSPQAQRATAFHWKESRQLRLIS